MTGQKGGLGGKVGIVRTYSREVTLTEILIKVDGLKEKEKSGSDGGGRRRRGGRVCVWGGLSGCDRAYMWAEGSLSGLFSTELCTNCSSFLLSPMFTWTRDYILPEQLHLHPTRTPNILLPLSPSTANGRLVQ